MVRKNNAVVSMSYGHATTQVKDLGYTPRLRVTVDPGVSSSTFLDNKEYREALFKLFQAQVRPGAERVSREGVQTGGEGRR